MGLILECQKMPKMPKNAKLPNGTFGNHLAIWHFLALFGIFWQLGILLSKYM